MMPTFVLLLLTAWSGAVTAHPQPDMPSCTLAIEEAIEQRPSEIQQAECIEVETVLVRMGWSV